MLKIDERFYTVKEIFTSPCGMAWNLRLGGWPLDSGLDRLSTPRSESKTEERYPL
jgi:hypothetical protein